MKPTHWKTLDGRVIAITDLETDHIVKILTMLRGEGAISISEASAMFMNPPTGDHALDAWEAGIMNLKVSRYIDPLLLELQRRKE